MPMISRKKLDSLKRHGRGAARRVGGGLKNNGMQVIAGVAALLIQEQLVKAMPSIATTGWWGPSAAMGALGLLAKRSRRFAGVGDALLGAAGYSGMLGYRMTHPTAAVAPVGAEAGRVAGGIGPRAFPRAVASLPNPAASMAEAGRVRGGVRSL